MPRRVTCLFVCSVASSLLPEWLSMLKFLPLARLLKEMQTIYESTAAVEIKAELLDTARLSDVCATLGITVQALDWWDCPYSGDPDNTTFVERVMENARKLREQMGNLLQETENAACSG